MNAFRVEKVSFFPSLSNTFLQAITPDIHPHAVLTTAFHIHTFATSLTMQILIVTFSFLFVPA